MATATDIAKYLRSKGVSHGHAVQKLLYYCQAWSLAWDGEPMFDDEIQAWRDGPVCPDVWRAGYAEGNPTALDERQVVIANAVLDFYGQKSAEWLVALTHRESPWMDVAPPPGQHGQAPISKDAIREYYTRWDVTRFGFDDAMKKTLEFLVETPEDVVREMASERTPRKLVDRTEFYDRIEAGDSSWEQSAN